MNEEGIRVRGLIKCYGGRRVVDGLTLSVKRGTVFGLLGANGAGKSTTIECILGTKKADAGEIRLLGQDPARDRKALFQRVGVQFQEGDYAQEIRVCELCEETASLYRNPADWRALCGAFGIGDKRKAAVKSLSGGERQRLFIVLALIPRPELVFLDELTTGLDARARHGVWKQLETLCDEICVLISGEAVFYGTVEDAKRQCGCERFEDAYASRRTRAASRRNRPL